MLNSKVMQEQTTDKEFLYSADDVTRFWLKKSVLNMTLYFFKELFNHNFIIGDHHLKIAEALDDVLSGKCTRLIINMPPRYGKTELAVKNFIAEGFAINPRSKFIHLSYSDDLARDNSAGVQDIVSANEFKRLFPDCEPTTKGTKKWENKAGGVLYAVSTGGQVTGFGAGLVNESDDKKADEELGDILNDIDRQTGAGDVFSGAIIIDDPVKPEDALSDNVREKINQRFENTIRNRVNSRKTPIIIIMQRLHENDLCGYLMESEPDKWRVLSLPAIWKDDKAEEHALWPHKHTLEELKKIDELTPFIFETQYMQNPRPLEGLMYDRPFREYDELLFTRQRTRKAYIDTADTGSDFLCAIIYDETETANYIVDVYFTTKGMETTEPETARRLTKYAVEIANIESNNGGRAFARNVERLCREMGNYKTRIDAFTQTENKEARIFTHSAEVMNLTFFPVGWNRLYPDFYKQITSYRKTGRNAHDDGPDALTGTVEKRKPVRTSAAAFF